MKLLNCKCLLICVSVFFSNMLLAQNRTITGKVSDAETNEPLELVVIKEQSGKNGTKSNADGTYTISISGQTKSFIVSMVGYEKQVVAISSSSTLDIKLKPGLSKLKELVVVAYGESTQKQITGSVAKINGKQIENIPSVSLDLILQGKVPGLQVSSSSGQPGAETEIRLRGIGSITAGSNPLYVVDGIPINSGYLGDGINVTWTSNSLSGINPNDIESISVLKDAAATAIYGSRGGNGVIIITTKKGKAGKTKFRFDVDYGKNALAFKKLAKPLNSAQYTELTYEGLMNGGYSDSEAHEMLESFGSNNNANTDWLDEVTQTGVQNSYNFSAQGGDQKTQFFVSGGYFKQGGTTLESNFDRLSGSLRLNHRASEKLKFNANLMLSSSNQKSPYQSAYFRSPIMAAYFCLPYMRPYDSTGEVNIDGDEFFFAYNPIATAKLDNNYLKNKKLIGGIGATYNLFEGLNFSSNLSEDYNITREFFYNNPFYGDADIISGSATMANTEVTNLVWTNLLNYQKTLFDKKLDMDIKLGHEAQKSEQNILKAYAEGFPFTTDIQVLSAAANPRQAFSSISEYAFESYFSNVSFGIKSKYLLTGTFRRDGSSRFGRNTRYGNFYSIGGSWILSEEDIIKNMKLFSSLRLRSSYGRNGNANIGNYISQSVYNYTANYVGGVGSAPVNPGNDNLTWEKNSPFNIGIDAAVLNNRLSFIVDWYHRKTSDLLLNVPVSQTTGFSEQLSNVGAMVNKGIEFAIDAMPVKTKAVNWNINFNMAINSNKITGLFNDQEFRSGVFLYRVGESVKSFYIPLWAGVDAQNGDPLWYTDSTKSATTNDYSLAKRAVAGNTQPKFFGALSNTVEWKSFSLLLQFNYVYGNQVYDYWGAYYNSDGANPYVNQTGEAIDRWQKPGDITNTPKFVYDNTSQSNSTSTRYLYDGSYIRLRNVALSYNVPVNYLNRYKISKLALYLKATNLWTWTKDKRMGFDPDISNGESDLNLPNMKTWIVGINLEF